MSFSHRFLRDESGFSLTELLTAMVIGSVVLLALMTLMTTGFQKSLEVSDRAEAAQSGRNAMDRIVTLLDAEICLDPTSVQVPIPPLIGGSDGNTVSFYADLNGVSDSPDKYTIAYDATAKTLTERRYDGAGTLPSVSWPSLTQTRVLATEVVPATDSNGTSLPIFRYFKYAANGLVDPTQMTTPVAQADALQVIRVQVAFRVISRRTKVDDRRATKIEGQSAVGTPDSSMPNAGSCP